MYGRGGADDGYALFAALTAVKNLQLQGVPHARYVVLIEFSEESGSPDLPHYLKMLEAQLGQVSLVVCLDSGTGDYERTWLTTSLRGLVVAKLNVQVLAEGSHSGKASGIVPDSFRVARMLLNRLENVETGTVLGEAFSCPIPAHRQVEAAAQADIVRDEVYKEFPRAGDLQPVTANLVECLLNRSWRAALTVTGAEGFPSIKAAGNVLRPSTVLSFASSFHVTLP